MKIKKIDSNNKKEYKALENNHKDNDDINIDDESTQLQYNFMVNSSIQYFLGAMDMWFKLNNRPLISHQIALKKLVDIKKNKSTNSKSLKNSPDPFKQFLGFFTDR